MGHHHLEEGNGLTKTIPKVRTQTGVLQLLMKVCNVEANEVSHTLVVMQALDVKMVYVYHLIMTTLLIVEIC